MRRTTQRMASCRKRGSDRRAALLVSTGVSLLLGGAVLWFLGRRPR